MLKRLEDDRFTWRTQRKDIINCVGISKTCVPPQYRPTFLSTQIDSCDVCHRSGKGLLKVRTELRQVAIKSKVWHLVGMDLIGALHPSTKKNIYILSLIDYFTKWPEATALPSKDGKTVVRALLDIFARNGPPSRIISDNGGEFINEV